MYLSQDLKGKAQTTGPDIADGSIELNHLSASLFLELQNIRLHTHEGSVSKRLGINAVPQAIAGYTSYERIEHYKATWTGTSASAGGVAITFDKVFKSAPTVVVTGTGRSGADLVVSTNDVTTSGVTVYWALTSGSATEIDIDVLVVGK